MDDENHSYFRRPRHDIHLVGAAVNGNVGWAVVDETFPRRIWGSIIGPKWMDEKRHVLRRHDLAFISGELS